MQHRDIEGELHELSDELKALVKHRDEVISTLDEIGLAASHKAEVLEERCNAYQEKKILVATLREEEKKPRARGGKNRFASTEYPETKIKVLKEWEKWPNKSAHGVRTAFAKKMLTKYSVLKSIEVVLRWIRERDNEENGKCDSAS